MIITMELKFKPLLISFLAFIFIFLAGWVSYDQWLQPSQLHNKFSEIKHSYVDIANDISEKDQVIRFTLSAEATLEDAVTELEQVISDTEYEGYELRLNNAEEAAYASEAWESVQYHVYEMIVKASYSQIPQISQQINEQYPQLDASISMDEQYVFVTLQHSEGSLHRLLPLKNQIMEVWNS